jgi:type VI secretion system protein ImpF
MARIREDQPLAPSVLDRLLDFDPQTSREAPKNRYQLLRELKDSVRRDLENLLNTRVRCRPLPEGLGELENSLVNYGVPDMTGALLSSPRERETFCRVLQDAIRRHEPRLKNVRLQLVENAEPLDRTLRFRIDALLQADPAPEPIVFDSSLQPSTGDVEVKGTG